MGGIGCFFIVLIVIAITLCLLVGWLMAPYEGQRPLNAAYIGYGCRYSGIDLAQEADLREMW
jgi:hypothetical protein